MNTDQKIIKTKVGLLELAKQLGNVSHHRMPVALRAEPHGFSVVRLRIFAAAVDHAHFRGHGSVYRRFPPGRVKYPNPMTRARWGVCLVS